MSLTPCLDRPREVRMAGCFNIWAATELTDNLCLTGAVCGSGNNIKDKKRSIKNKPDKICIETPSQLGEKGKFTGAKTRFFVCFFALCCQSPQKASQKKKQFIKRHKLKKHTGVIPGRNIFATRTSRPNDSSQYVMVLDCSTKRQKKSPFQCKCKTKTMLVAALGDRSRSVAFPLSPI